MSALVAVFAQARDAARLAELRAADQRTPAEVAEAAAAQAAIEANALPY